MKVRIADIRQSPQYSKYMRSRGWKVEIIPALTRSRLEFNGLAHESGQNNFAYIRKLGFLPFSVMKIQRFSLLPDFEVIESLALKHRVLSVTLEPGIIPEISSSRLIHLFNSHRYRKSRWPMLPTKTIRIDLSRDKQTLFKDMKKDARASIKKARRFCDIGLASSDDQKSVTGFYRFFSRWGKGYIPKLSEFQALFEAFEHDVFIVSCFSKRGLLLAGTVILIADDCAYYYFAATSSQGRRTFAGYLAVWEAMLEAKRRGCRFFDFEGIYDDRFNQLKRWRGFSSFKKKFGGEEITFPAPFVRNFFPFPVPSFLDRKLMV